MASNKSLEYKDFSNEDLKNELANKDKDKPEQRQTRKTKKTEKTKTRNKTQ